MLAGPARRHARNIGLFQSTGIYLQGNFDIDVFKRLGFFQALSLKCSLRRHLKKLPRRALGVQGHAGIRMRFLFRACSLLCVFTNNVNAFKTKPSPSPCVLTNNVNAFKSKQRPSLRALCALRTELSGFPTAGVPFSGFIDFHPAFAPCGSEVSVPTGAGCTGHRPATTSSSHHQRAFLQKKNPVLWDLGQAQSVWLKGLKLFFF